MIFFILNLQVNPKQPKGGNHMTQYHEELTKKTLHTTRSTTMVNYDHCLRTLEAIRKKELGGRGIVYREKIHGRIFDSASGEWADGPGYKLYLMEIL